MPPRRGEPYEMVHIDEAATLDDDRVAALVHSMRHTGTAVVRVPLERTAPRSYRPRWAARLAATLAQYTNGG